MSDRTQLAIIGAGPIGLEAALAASDAGLGFVLLEADTEVAANVRRWGHVRLFTPWTMNVSDRARTHLAEAGVRCPDGGECPTGQELFERLLAPLAHGEHVAPRLRRNSKVVAISRDGLLKDDAIGAPSRRAAPFRLLLEEDGEERVLLADAVIDCSGTYHNPNALGSGGIPAPGERSCSDRVIRHIPDFEKEEERFRGSRILIVGGGHSAQTAAVDLAEFVERFPATRVTWAIRSARPTFDPDPHDLLQARRELHAAAERIAHGGTSITVVPGRVVERLHRREDGVSVLLSGAESREPLRLEVDWILGLTGAVGDHAMYRQLQVHECWATSGPMKLAASLLADGSADCLDQPSPGPEVLRNPEPDFFIVGSKSYGRTNSFLLRVGWEQVDQVISIVAAERTGAGSHQDQS